jgi:hypothetical protein
MKRNLRIVAAASLLACMVATDALAAGHGGGFAPGNFGSGHMGRGFGEPFPGGTMSAPAPIYNPSTPYTVSPSPETPVSPASPGSVFGNG